MHFHSETPLAEVAHACLDGAESLRDDLVPSRPASPSTGRGRIGTSIAMAARCVGCRVTGWDADPAILSWAADYSGLSPLPSLDAAVGDAEIIVVATPIDTIPALVARCLYCRAGRGGD